MIWFGKHRQVDRHFAGMGTPGRDRRMFDHLRGCERCRARYRIYARLESMTGGGEDEARGRLGRGIFPSGARRRLLGAGIGITVACAAAVLLVARPRDDGFRGRGGAGTPEGGGPALSIFRVAPDGVTRTQRAGGDIRSGEPLAFSFSNPFSKSYARLMVFAVDGSGRVFWFWPAWTNAADDPVSIAISPGSEPMELGESVRHPLTPGRVTIYGLFSQDEHHVREVEAALQHGADGLKALRGYLWSETLDVSR
ncbi:MAG TPA: hypothetical protein VMU50_11560 [Polyangia bacterium]|nr:hypothetical protein [Polyangia bacterium]